jgi:hypothetical protein
LVRGSFRFLNAALLLLPLRDDERATLSEVLVKGGLLRR